MRVTIETTNIKELELLMRLLQELNLENIRVVELPEIQSVQELGPSISKGDKSIDPSGLFGIWEKNPRTIEEIRGKSWDRNWN